MLNKKLITRLLAIAFFVLFITTRLSAQNESYIQSLTGVIKANDSCWVIDEKFADQRLWGDIKKNKKVRNVITFEVRFDTTLNFYSKPFKCELVADIEYKDSSRRTRTISNVKLDIQYDTAKGKPYKGIAYYRFNGGHEVTVKVKSITSDSLDVSTASFLRVKNQIYVEREYKIKRIHNSRVIHAKHKTNTNPSTGDITGSQLDFSWDTDNPAGRRFDVEYTFYDAGSSFYKLIAANPNNLTTDPNSTGVFIAPYFRNNATRVNPLTTPYTVNLIYPKGVLLFRIRPFSYDNVTGDRIEDEWDYSSSGLSGLAVFLIDDEHEEELSWQYNSVFAEDAKSKEVVSYFDGTFKSRQSVTINKTNEQSNQNVAIVQETILDKLNRPAVNVLPVPTTENMFHYFRSFNLNIDADGNHKPYSYADFQINDCGLSPLPMNTNSGASKYYSPLNPFIGNSNYPIVQNIVKDIPDANGFPFAVTEYTNDLTGRIRRQGGVGEIFQPGTNNSHETVYYYGKPAQRDLDRLFGSEAGNASHYSKNMVVDANGQVSVSYVDMAGKTIATALAGNKPDNLKDLSSLSENGSVRTITDELIHPQGLVRDAGNMKVSFNSTVMVPSDGEYTFKYEFSRRSLALIFGWNPSRELCADCYYDVKFSISDECGNPVSLTYNNTPYPTSLVIPALGTNETPNTDCNIPTPDPNRGTITAIFPKVGEYNVSYELTMSRKALDFYMDYLKQAAVMKTQNDINREYLRNIDISGCFTDCKSCVSKIGSRSEFRARMELVCQNLGLVLNGDDLHWLETDLYDAATTACTNAITKNCSVIDGCADYRKMMLKDVSPGGQYMLYDEGTLLFKERKINVFLICQKAESDIHDSSPLIMFDNAQRHIGTLTEAEVISKWDPEWAYLLLRYHPEADLLTECEAQSASKNRDKDMLQTDKVEDDDDHDGAIPKFSWNHNDYTSFLQAEFTAIGTGTTPYYSQCIKDAITTRMNNFIEVPTSANGPAVYISLYQFIKFTVYCDNKPAPVAGTQPGTTYLPYVDLVCGVTPPPTCDRSLEEWRLFRNLYMAIKEEAYRNPTCKNSNSKNCYIGVNVFSTIYNEKADPNYYPKPQEFSIEAKNGILIVKYNGSVNGVNNRCDVHIYKADNSNGYVDAIEVSSDPILTNPVKPFQFTTTMFSGGTTGDQEKIIPNSDVINKDLYYVESVVNNYNHNIDGTIPPSFLAPVNYHHNDEYPEFSTLEYPYNCTGPSVNCNCSNPPVYCLNCPNASDFEATANNGHTLDIKYIGKYPLLNKVKLYVYWGCNGPHFSSVTYEPLETGIKSVTVNSAACSYRTWDGDGTLLCGSQFCIGNAASCISDPRWPDYFQKTRRFYQSADVGDIATVLNQGNGTTPSNTNNYTQYCTNMAEGWIEKIKGCMPIANPVLEADLKKGLIAVCVGGSDVNHPFGASTLPAGQTVVVDNHTYTSFENVIRTLTGGETPTCSHLLIDFPLPYDDKTLLNDNAANTLTLCGYNLLTHWQAEWIALGTNSQYPTLADYIKDKYDTHFYLTDAQITLLIATYLSGCPLQRPMILPGILTRCENPATPTCLNCTDLDNVEQLFHIAYPSLDNTMTDYYDLFAAFINEKYQMNVAPTEVYLARQKCIAKQNPIGNKLIISGPPKQTEEVSVSCGDGPADAVLNIVNPTCANNGSITVTSIATASGGFVNVTGPVTGPPSIQYSINDGESWHYTNVFTDLYPGQYSLRIRFCGCPNAWDCVEMPAKSVTVTGSYEFNITANNITVTPSFCNDGSITVAGVTGSTGIYTYQLTYPNELTPRYPPQTSPIFENLAPGTYGVRILDGCNSVFYLKTIDARTSSNPFNTAPELNCLSNALGEHYPVFTQSSSGCTGNDSYTLRPWAFGYNATVSFPCEFTVVFPPTPSYPLGERRSVTMSSYNWSSLESIPIGDYINDGYFGPFYVEANEVSCDNPTYRSYKAWFTPINSTSLTPNTEVMKKCDKINLSFGTLSNKNCYTCPVLRSGDDWNITPTYNYTGSYKVSTDNWQTWNYNNQIMEIPCSTTDQSLSLQVKICPDEPDPTNSHSFTGCHALNIPACSYDFSAREMNSLACLNNTGMFIAHDKQYVDDENLVLIFTQTPIAQNQIYNLINTPLHLSHGQFVDINGFSPLYNLAPGDYTYTITDKCQNPEQIISQATIRLEHPHFYELFTSSCPTPRCHEGEVTLIMNNNSYVDVNPTSNPIPANYWPNDYRPIMDRNYYLVNFNNTNWTIVSGSDNSSFLDDGTEKVSSLTFPPTSVGTYQMSISHHHNISSICASILPVTISDPLPDLSATLSILCTGTTGIVSINVTNGRDPYIYSLFDETNNQPVVSSSNPSVFTGLSPDNEYIATVQDYCTSINSVRCIFHPYVPVIKQLGSSCIGNNVSLSTDFIPGATYVWSKAGGSLPGNTTINPANTLNINSVQSYDYGIYSVVVTVPDCSTFTATLNFTPGLSCTPYPLPGEYVLCSQPITPLYFSDSLECLTSTVRAALSNADYAYNQYVDSFMRDYREAYFAKCMSITPSLTISGEQHEYHYTLYYYDQSGNLVKTIPPAGVVPLDDNTRLTQVGRLREQDNLECFQNAVAPKFEYLGQKLTVSGNLYPLHKNGPLTLEAWIKCQPVAGLDQVILDQFNDDGEGNKAGYYAYLDGSGKLHFRIYGRSTEKWEEQHVNFLYANTPLFPSVTAHGYNVFDDDVTRHRLFKAECSTLNDITPNTGQNDPFHHVVFQYSGNPEDHAPVKIFVDGVLQSLNWPSESYVYGFNDTKHNEANHDIPTIDDVRFVYKETLSPFTTSSNTDLTIGNVQRTVNSVPYEGFNGSAKQLRIYNALLDAPDIRRSSFNDCLTPVTQQGLALWLPLAKETADGSNQTEDLISGSNASITAAWPALALPQYPEHNLPTYYAYNSLNQVVEQVTPDAGVSHFWYDRLGRLVVSQNAKQAVHQIENTSQYSYTLYDDQGRIVEVGEKNYVDITGVNTKNDDELNAWMSTGLDKQVTKTVYDNPYLGAPGQVIIAQDKTNNNRKRVVTSLYMDEKSDDADNYQSATHYVYDIAGNVKRLYQENKLAPSGQTLKTLDYDFDLHSGKVNNLTYQKDQQDQYYYEYKYDPENRILEAWSGRDPTAPIRQDASYLYNLHGPLARTELGDKESKVQGVDYAYTLQGWLKGINGLFLGANTGGASAADLGGDGGDIPNDVYAYTLGYYDGDYKPIYDRGGQHPISVRQFGFNNGSNFVGALNPTGYQLFNGNIAYATYANRALMGRQNPALSYKSVSTYSYSYDQLNRLKEMRAHNDFSSDISTDWNHSTTIEDYKESISYDANGNILSYLRNGYQDPYSGQQKEMDNIQYNYQDLTQNNKLDNVNDQVLTSTYGSDIKDGQYDGNYEYDNIGNLTKDRQENIDAITWTVYGKIKSISKTDGTFIEYSYDPSGNRIMKTVTGSGATVTTYYFRDATGNVMGVYEDYYDGSPVTWKEQHLYGSSRLGLWHPEELMNGITSEPYAEIQVGSREYELTNHLGNVMATVSDKKVGDGGCPPCPPGSLFCPACNTPTVSFYKAEILSAQDYYPFGMLMPGRNNITGNGYRYSINGQEKDKELNDNITTAKFWEYDSRIGRRWNLDPKPIVGISDYSVFANSPMYYSDPFGDVVKVKHTPNKDEKLKERNMTLYKQLLSEKMGNKVDVNIDSKTDELSLNLKDGAQLTKGEQKVFDKLINKIEQKEVYTYGINSGDQASMGDRNGYFFKPNYNGYSAVINVDLVKELEDGGRHKPFSAGNMLLFAMAQGKTDEFKEMTGIEVQSFKQGILDKWGEGSYERSYYTKISLINENGVSNKVTINVIQMMPLTFRGYMGAGTVEYRGIDVNWIRGHNMGSHWKEYKKEQKLLDKNSPYAH